MAWRICALSRFPYNVISAYVNTHACNKDYWHVEEGHDAVPLLKLHLSVAKCHTCCGDSGQTNDFLSTSGLHGTSPFFHDSSCYRLLYIAFSFPPIFLAVLLLFLALSFSLVLRDTLCSSSSILLHTSSLILMTEWETRNFHGWFASFISPFFSCVFGSWRIS